MLLDPPISYRQRCHPLTELVPLGLGVDSLKLREARLYGVWVVTATKVQFVGQECTLGFTGNVQNFQCTQTERSNC